MVTKKTTKTKKKSFFKSLKKNIKKQYKVAKKVGASSLEMGGKALSTGAKYGGKALDIADKITIGTEKARSGLYLGNVVKITNGEYTNRSITIVEFVHGGIVGRLKSGQMIKIRHGSYKTQLDKYPKYENYNVFENKPRQNKSNTKNNEWMNNLEKY